MLLASHRCEPAAQAGADAADAPAAWGLPHGLDLALLNRWQHDFPRVAEPFVRIANELGLDAGQVIERYRTLIEGGSVSRIGGVFGAGAGGSALLCAMAVPPARLDAVAAQVSAHPGVNHNYEREHALNLWFVMTGCDGAQVHADVAALEVQTGCPALRLAMQRAHRIDLGFDLGAATARHRDGGTVLLPQRVPAVAADERALAALLEAGLPLLPRPYDAWARAWGYPRDRVLATLERWLATGTLRRFGVVVRHHELGFAANAMTVFDVPDAGADALGDALARQPGVTLAYRRSRAPGWPYNLYCMVHGRDRAAVHAVLERAIANSGLSAHAHEVLFSRRRFKQSGARYFCHDPTQAGHVAD